MAYLVLEVGDTEVEDIKELTELGEGHISPPVPQCRAVHILENPEETDEQVPGRLRTQQALAILKE